MEVINSELNQVTSELNDEKLSEDDKKYKASYKKKLVRYKKFFKYRNKDLQFRGEKDTELIQKEILRDLEFLDKNNRNKSLTEFFDKYNEDTLGATLSFVLKSMKEEGEDYSAIVDKILELNKLLFGKSNKKTSYLYAAYKIYIDGNSNTLTEVSGYTTLINMVKEKNIYVRKKTDNIRSRLVKDELKKGSK